jgi:hypothetical protein
MVLTMKLRAVTLPKRATAFLGDNRRAAALILSDSAKHGGPESGLVAWARLILATAPGKRLESGGAQPCLPGVEAGNGNR